jgi:outer membrane protein OmpA-like peptidoglycan-associated protein
MWQVGLGGGSFFVSGDVKSQFGWGASVFARKSLGYSTSLRLEYMFGQARGLNYTPSFQGAHPNISPFTVTDNGNVTPGLYSPDAPFYANYFIPQFHALSLQGMFNLNNLRFHRKSNRWSFNILAGIGANLYQTRYNALDPNGNPYDFRFVASGLDPEVRADRQSIRDNIKSLLDDDYETVAQLDRRNGFIVGKDDKAMTLRPFVSLGFSMEYMLTPRLSIALEHQTYFSADDFLDGKSRNEAGTRTGGMDIPHYTSVRLGFHLGSKEKRVPPLWFVNPMTHPLNDIADLKSKLDDEWFKDDDKDGVVNKLDEEPDTKPDTRVDTKGRTLDSDGDGIPDSQDKEPFSPPGYPTTPEGVAQVPPPLNEKDVVRIGDERYELKGQKPAASGGGSLNDWFLPMVHYDMNEYYLRSEAYGDLHHIARVMQSYPNMKIVVHGHADTRASNEYNEMLSYNRAMSAIDYLNQQYGISRDRFIVKYSGKSVTLVKDIKGENDHFMNRRVEFYVAKEGDKSQERPKGDGGMNRKWKY